MPTSLLIPLVGPLQSWGIDSRFGERLTGSEPSKSGVLGLVCAALGRDRMEPIDDVAALCFGVRIDRPGTLLRDYHTAVEVAAAGSSQIGTVVSQRWYLSDAAFLAGFEGDAALLSRIHAALANPHWPVFLGRKSCPPSVPLFLPGGVVDASLPDALRSAPPLVEPEGPAQIRLVIEDPEGAQRRPDQPIGPFSERHFGQRRARTEFMQWN